MTTIDQDVLALLRVQTRPTTAGALAQQLAAHTLTVKNALLRLQGAGKAVPVHGGSSGRQLWEAFDADAS